MVKERRDYWAWLVVIIIIGCALRVYHLIDIPFTYDELSALHRTHYSTFHDLIKNGIAPDGHPAGVQVFLFYWTKLVGETEWLIKLPFILMGICCIPLIYRIGSRWFSRDAGIITACLVACLQYTVMYSQIARPYISGLFLILLLVVVWNEVMTKITWRNLFAYSVLLALCAYNHYFSLLTAGCIVMTGFFVIERKALLKYVLAVLLTLAFFIPHIPLFFAQLNLKGLGWISAPKPDFFKYYFNYVFNFSCFVIATVVFFVVQGLCISIRKKEFGQHKYRIITLLWFVVPAVIGYFYSVYRAPVLQTSVLIFSFPFLILFICSFIRLPENWLRNMQIAGLLIILTASLIWERNYYHIFYHQQVETFAKHIAGYEKAYSNNKVTAFVNTESTYLDFYKSKYKTGWTYQTFDSIGGNIGWRKWLEKSDAQYLVLCNAPIEWGNQYVAIAQEYFPCVDSIYYGFTTDIYILKRNKDKCAQTPAPVFSYTLKDSTGVRVKYKLHPDTSANDDTYLTCDTINNWGLFFATARQLRYDKELMINISVDVYSDTSRPEGILTLRFFGSQSTCFARAEKPY